MTTTLSGMKVADREQSKSHRSKNSEACLTFATQVSLQGQVLAVSEIKRWWERKWWVEGSYPSRYIYSKPTFCLEVRRRRKTVRIDPAQSEARKR